MWSYLWPVLMVITANTCYHLFAKLTPGHVQPFASLVVTYFTSAVLSCILFFLLSPNKNLVAELRNLNWTSVAFGFALVALEFGYLQIYRVGWNISVGSLVTNIGLACVLVILGKFVFHETLYWNQMLGMGLCILGIVLINIRA